MPEMDGFEATRRLREREKVSREHTTIIALTAHAMAGDRNRCLAAGMNSYLAKPINADRLFDVVEKALKPADGKSPEPSRKASDQVFDLNMLLSHCDGDRELAAKIIRVFLKSNPAQLAELRCAVERRTSEMIVRAAHTIKGSIGNFGAAAAIDAATRLEKIGRDRRLEKAREALALLEEEIERLKESFIGFEEGMRQ
jgi:HPt (histidine-containing phosphotransfer) domain-containing protein